MIKDLSGKKILFISPRFFGYETEIAQQMRDLGASVDYFDERPSNSFLVKVLIRIGYKKIICFKIAKYYRNIINNLYNQYDFLLIINTETISINILKELKKRLPNAKVVIYMWDSVINKKQQLSLVDFVDKFITFDFKDTITDNRIKFIPLFYSSKYSDIAKREVKPKYDMVFIGSAHGDRYEIVKKIERQLGRESKNFLFFYSPSRIMFYVKKMFCKNFKQFKFSDISFYPLSHSQIIDIIQYARVVVDIEHVNQSGLTMRTIEMLGASRKLITTNHNIINYDFYQPENIYVIDRYDIKIDKEFWELKYKKNIDHIYEGYSLRSWVLNVLEF